MLMQEYQEELREINIMLEDKNKEYETKASTDPLTGLYNRYKFSELYLSSYTAMTQRHYDMSLILLDIDFFKKVNDNYGHNMGDQVLIQVSHALLKILRNIDIVCRWGGEEFALLLPHVTIERAEVIANNLRAKIELAHFPEVNNITCSFGVASYKVGDSVDNITQRADIALYDAKDGGRNRVCFLA